MAQFKITKRISLAELGTDWSDCYLEFRQITFGEAKAFVGLEDDPQKATDVAIGVLEDHFIDGKAIDIDGNTVDVKKKDIQDFPANIIAQAIQELVGKVPQNA